MQIGLLESLDVGKSAMATALQPIPAQVCFSEKGLDDCKLEVDWRQLGVCMPPPVRFQRRARNFKTIQRTKRRRLGE